MTNEQKRCLVTGGAGFIGSHLVELLLATGHQVRVLDNLSTGKIENLEPVQSKIEFISGDILDETVLEKTTQAIDWVFHLAAMVSVPQSMAEPVAAEQINAVGTIKLLQAAQKAGVRRLVFSSTCAVYGDEPTLPKTENSAIAPQSPYAISKHTAAEYCRLFNDPNSLETVVLRYFNVYGPRQDPSSPYSGVISIFVHKLSRQETITIFGDGQQTRDFVYVGDVVRANLLAAQTPTAGGQSFNIGTGQPISIQTLLETVCGVLNQPVQVTYQPARPGDIRHSYADATRAKHQLNWQAQNTLTQGLSALLAG